MFEEKTVIKDSDGNEKIITKQSDGSKTIEREIQKKDDKIVQNKEIVSDIGGNLFYWMKFFFNFYFIC